MDSGTKGLKKKMAGIFVYWGEKEVRTLSGGGGVGCGVQTAEGMWGEGGPGTAGNLSLTRIFRLHVDPVEDSLFRTGWDLFSSQPHGGFFSFSFFLGRETL